jgi:hypothetical protein
MALTLVRIPWAHSARRPFGLYVIAGLQALNALSHGFGVLTGLEDAIVEGIPGIDSQLIGAVVAVVGLVVAAGLLLLARWAWVAAMLWVGLIMVVEIVLYWRGEDANYVVMAISVLQVFYLNQSDVQAAFTKRRLRELELG